MSAMLRPLSPIELVTAASILEHLGRFLPKDHFDTAFDILAVKLHGTSISDAALGSRALSSLPDALLPRILERLPGEAHARAPVLKSIAPRLPESLVGQAFRSAEAIPEGYWSAMACAALVLRLPADERERAVRKVIDQISALPNPHDGFQLWRDIAPAMTRDTLRRVGRASSPGHKPGCLTDLLEAGGTRIPRAELEAAAPDLLEAVKRHGVGVAVQARLVAALAAGLSPDQRDAAVALVRGSIARSDSGLAKVEAMAIMAPLLSAEDLFPLHGEINRLAGLDYVRGTSVAAPWLPENIRVVAVRKALEIAAQPERGWKFSSRQVWWPAILAKFLPHPESVDALLAAFRMSRFTGSQEDLVQLVGEMEQQISGADLTSELREELAVPEGIFDLSARARRLRELGPLMDKGGLVEDWEKAIQETVTLTKASADVRKRISVLGDLADFLTQEEGEEALREALAPFLDIAEDPSPKPMSFAPMPAPPVGGESSAWEGAAGPLPQYFITRVLGQEQLPDIAIATLPGQPDDYRDLAFIRDAMVEDESIRPDGMSDIESGPAAVITALQQVIIEAAAQQELNLSPEAVRGHADAVFRTIQLPIMNSPLSGLTLDSLTAAAGSGALAYMAAFGDMSLKQAGIYLLFLGGAKVVIGTTEALNVTLRHVMPRLASKWLGLPPPASGGGRSTTAQSGGKGARKRPGKTS